MPLIRTQNTVAGLGLEGFLWFLQEPLLKPEETLQDKFATNLYTAVEVYSFVSSIINLMCIT